MGLIKTDHNGYEGQYLNRQFYYTVISIYSFVFKVRQYICKSKQPPGRALVVCDCEFLDSTPKYNGAIMLNFMCSFSDKGKQT